MSGHGKVTSVDHVQPDNDTIDVIRLATDWPHAASSVDIPADTNPHPQIGDLISWGPHHVQWNGETLRKIGWEVDPNAPIH
ncbi:hypothetical protein [Sphingomonas sp. CARO-RG-8B-R24-01]|uniref:hypothetical protein n=1 Tax=Sphingomonas sp. CARO-RG-8B-R24-01 TaxID=2914831 RepID=UPI001F5757D7|nr:hypothetical protein [Sphingomonas sp. CARO-RG-8B-R24-01]